MGSPSLRGLAAMGPRPGVAAVLARLSVGVIAASLLVWGPSHAASPEAFNPSPHAIEIPRWFKETFLDFREDIAEATVEGKRLMAYYRETAPLIGYYFAKGKLHCLDGMAPIPEVSAKLDDVLNSVAAP